MSQAFRYCLAAAAWALLSSGSFAGAAELRWMPVFQFGQTLTDNVYNVESPRVTDTATVLSPGLTVERWTDRTRQALSYALAVERFWRNEDLDMISHAGSIESQWQASERSVLALSNRGVYSPREYRSIFPDTISRPQQLRVRSLRNESTLGGFFRLNERTDIGIPLGFRLEVFDEEPSAGDPEGGVIDTYTADAEIRVARRVSTRDTLTPTGRFARIWFDGRTDTNVVEGRLDWSRQWDERFSTSVGAGVTGLLSGSGEGSSVSVSGGASLDRAFERAGLTGAYSRQVQSGSGFGVALIQDTVSASVSWRPLDRFVFDLTSGYFHSESKGSTGAITVDGVFAEPGITYRINSVLSLRAAYEWRFQKRDGRGAVTRNLAELTLSVSPVLE